MKTLLSTSCAVRKDSGCDKTVWIPGCVIPTFKAN
jgi:hypothetical protein